MAKYGVISGPYFPVFVVSPNTGKYGPEITQETQLKNLVLKITVKRREEKMFYFSLFELFSIVFLFSQMLNTPIYASPALKSKFLDHSGFIKSTRHSLTLSRKLPYFPSFFEIEQGFVYRIPFIDCNFNLKISWGKMCRFCQYHEIVGNKAKRANRYFKKIKHCKFSEKRTFFTP